MQKRQKQNKQNKIKTKLDRKGKRMKLIGKTATSTHMSKSSLG